MFRLARAWKGYREAGSLNEQINLFGFVDEHTFLTKSGDVGMVLAVKGVDYECLASSEIDNYTKRLESACPVGGLMVSEGFHQQVQSLRGTHAFQHAGLLDLKGVGPVDTYVWRPSKKLESQLADREYRRIVRELRLRARIEIEREMP